RVDSIPTPQFTSCSFLCRILNLRQRRMPLTRGSEGNAASDSQGVGRFFDGGDFPGSVCYTQDRVIIRLPPFEWAGRQQGSIGRNLLAQCDRRARAEKLEYRALAP